MRYRTKQILQLGYFAQVKPHWYSRWKTIGKHRHCNIGFILHKEGFIKHPFKSEEEAIDHIRHYQHWKITIKQKKQITYDISYKPR